MDFSNPQAVFISSFVIGLSGAMMPGPLLALAVKETTRRGFVAAPLIVLGHGILEATLLLALSIGLADYLQGDVTVSVIALTGSVVLLLMSWKMFREIPTLQITFDRRQRDAEVKKDLLGGSLRPVVDGVVASLANPYWSVWWATIGLGYLALSSGAGDYGVAAFFAGHVLSDVAWYLFVGAGVTIGRRWFTLRAYRVLVGGCAVLLVVFAFVFGAHGIAKLF